MRKETAVKKGIRLLVAVDMMFLLLMSVSASFVGVVGDLIYLCAFAIPFAFGWFSEKRLRYEREEERGVAESAFPRFGLERDGAKLFLPLIFPTVGIVLGIALLTSLLLNSLGASSAPVADEALIKMLVAHALLPSVLEEMLFRYLPLKVLYPYSPRAAVLISSLLFALIHLDLYKMPYAFAAGIVLVLADALTGSIIPSLVIHFINNASSVALMKYGELGGFTAVFYSALGILCVGSVAVIAIRYKSYLHGVRSAFFGRIRFDISLALITALSILIALINLIG